jgi:glutathione S-transferase
MTYRLYNRDGSGGFVVEAALVLTGAPFELVKLDSLPGTPLPESYRDINPWGQVPALITPSGTLLTECAAILIHLANCHQEKKLAPPVGSESHGVFLRWCVFLAVNVYEAVLRRAYPDRFTTDPSGHDAVAQAARIRLREGLDVVEAAITPGQFLLGPDLSLADVFLAMLNAWHRADNGLTECDAITHRIAAHPDIAPVWRRNFDHRLKTRWGRQG